MTSSINTSFATKQANITPGVGLKFSGATLNGYQLYGNSVQSQLAIDDIMFNGFYVAEALNNSNHRNKYKLNNYDPRWNTNFVPSTQIQCLHFKNGPSIAEGINLSSGQVELQVHFLKE